MRRNDLSIGLVTFPIEKSGVVPLNNLLTTLLETIGGDIYLISGNRADQLNIKNSRVRVRHLCHQKGGNLVSRLKNYLVTQIAIAHNMLLLRRNINVWYFYFGGELLVLPLVIGKITRKSVLLHLPNSCVNDAKAKGSRLYPIIRSASEFSFHIADKLIVASEGMKYTFGLNKYLDKVRITNEYYVDSVNFMRITDIGERSNNVGFVGRLSEEKGILNFIHSIPLILDQSPDLTFFIGGDGPLYDNVYEYIAEHDLADKVILSGWIDHEDLPKYLNTLKLLVIPSYSEAGPIIAYEAMACGTAVVGTRVGCVLMNLEDRVSGYLLRDNSPECIAANVIQALNSPNLEQIAENGRQFVGGNFTFEATVARWKKVFEEI